MDSLHRRLHRLRSPNNIIGGHVPCPLVLAPKSSSSAPSSVDKTSSSYRIPEMNGSDNDSDANTLRVGYLARRQRTQAACATFPDKKNC